MFSIAIHPILLALCLAFFAVLCPVGGANARRHQKTAKKDHPNSVNNSDEYDYRVDDDYSIGVFVDAVPITEKGDDDKKTPAARDGKAYKRTNRYPTKKLRKFFDASNARREWYEALFSSGSGTADRRRRR